MQFDLKAWCLQLADDYEKMDKRCRRYMEPEDDYVCPYGICTMISSDIGRLYSNFGIDHLFDSFHPLQLSITKLPAYDGDCGRFDPYRFEWRDSKGFQQRADWLRQFAATLVNQLDNQPTETV